jgi:RNA polymerase sigma-70 factor (ECF subfamily)
MSELPPSQDETASLIVRIQRHDEGAARILVERLGPLVAKIIGSYSALREELDDLAQDVFFKIFRSLHTWRGKGALEHWAARIARCACIDRLRRKKARPEQRMADLTPAETALLENAPSVEALPHDRAADAFSLLGKLLDTLAPLDAWLLRQIEFEERTVADVAAEAGWNVGATHVRLFRARARLKRAFQNTP